MRILVNERGIGLEFWQELFDEMYADCGLGEVVIDYVETTEEVLEHVEAGLADWTFILLNNSVVIQDGTRRSLAHCSDAEIGEFLKRVVRESRKPLICSCGISDPHFKTICYKAGAKYYFELIHGGEKVWRIIRAKTVPNEECLPGNSRREQAQRESTAWYRRVADAGDPVASFLTGWRLETGKGTGQDASAARDYYQQAVRGIRALAKNMDTSTGIEISDRSAYNQEQVVAWYTSLAAAGLPEACAIMGAIEFFGICGSKDEKLARKWLQIAAEKENAIAQNLLGILLATPNGEQFDAGMQWMRRAARRGNGLAMQNLWIALFQKQVEPEPGEIDTQYLHDAAEQGFTFAQMTLGTCFLFGLGAEKNPDMSIFWYFLAARGGQAAGLSNVALHIFSGRDFPKDRARGYAFMRLAIELGDDKSAGLTDWMMLDMSDEEITKGEEFLKELLKEVG